ncbi:MAG TPA: 30S ribosomal protein S12 methylthiotransferase RimO [Firmicutes bacterium]|nr:30S ribosomal protein S12 methylthiotransferase RimO [Bacillota bacterium]
MKIGIVSLGCAKNLVDTEIVLGFLQKAGHEFVSDAQQAEIIIINTCGFIAEAKEESIDSIFEMAALKKAGNCRGLIVIGCLSQRYSEKLWQEIPEIDGILGSNELDLVPQVVEEVARGRRLRKIRGALFDYNQVYPRVSTTGGHLAYLKIAEGCSHRCAFCVIPKIRGPYRSRQPSVILEEAGQMAQNGVQEIAVIAQDTTAYGRDLGTGIEDLLADLAKVPIPWLRLLYTYPTAISDTLLDIIGREERIVKYVDLPLQHVSKPVLRRMKRPGDYEANLRLVEKIRERIPGVVIRSSFIVGFPGEREHDFQKLLQFLEEARLNHVGIFKYSREENSSAYKLQPQIAFAVKKERQQEAMARQRQISLELNRQLVGKTVDVLLEHVSTESELVLLGRHQGQAPDVDGCVYVGRGSLEPGRIVPVKITEAHPYDLVGEVVENEFT